MALVPYKNTELLDKLSQGHVGALARAITIVENDLSGSDDLLAAPRPHCPAAIIGITGAPGAGKSTLTEALVQYWVAQGKRIAILAVDPSSPFNFGALLGDRIRMSRFYNHDQVFIRSLSSRGALGGLNSRIWEVTEVVKAAPFDYIIIETVGVGQSEVDIAGLADCTIVTLVPEGGDDIQTIKSGIMEIADIFAINKSDRPGADAFYHKVVRMVHERPGSADTPVIKTVATKGTGIPELATAVTKTLEGQHKNEQRKAWMITEKIWQLVQRQRMQGLQKQDLFDAVRTQAQAPNFNWYTFAKNYF